MSKPLSYLTYFDKRIYSDRNDEKCSNMKKLKTVKSKYSKPIIA